MNYTDVKEQLMHAGFTNIKVEAKGDLIIGIFHHNGDTDKISIDGVTSFSVDDWFNKDAKIVIRYHSYPKR